MLIVWIKKRRDNNQTYYLELNGNRIPIELKRIKTWNQQVNELINKKEFERNIGYFKYNSNAFNSYLIYTSVDLIWVDVNGFIINIEEDFPQNKISKNIKDTKFLYVFSSGFVKSLDIKKKMLFKHYRNIKKGWYE